MKTICIMCPMGCPLTVERTEKGVEVTGNTCKRGLEYGIQEFTAPKRVVTSLVNAENGKVVSVKTSTLIDKGLIFKVLDELKCVKLSSPVKIGDVIILNVCGSGADIIATSALE